MRWAVILAIVAFGCGGTSDATFQQAFDAAHQAMRRGAIDEALSSIDRVQRPLDAAPDTFHAHQARLLRAEILIAKPNLAQAGNLLDLPVPAGESFAPLRARDRYLRARLLVARGQLPQALSAA